MTEATAIFAPILRKSTPVLVVDAIAPALAFWRKLDLVIATEVPEGEGPQAGFAILAGPGIEIMYQTIASVSADLIASARDPDAFRRQAQQGYLFVEVQDLAEIEHRLAGEHMVLPHRTTFYGAKELGYSDGAGNIIVFAQFAAVPAAE